jgi:hypothetical protein
MGKGASVSQPTKNGLVLLSSKGSIFDNLPKPFEPEQDQKLS